MRRTIDREDDLELARQLIAAARDSTDSQKLVELACDQAYELSKGFPTGYAIAASAMELLADTTKSRRTDAREKQVDLLTRLSRSGKPEERAQTGKLLMAAVLKMGDEQAASGNYLEAIRVYRQARSMPTRDLLQTEFIDWNLAVLAQRQRAVGQIEKLREKLLADANDHNSANTLIRLHLIDMNDPQGALKFLPQSNDKDIKSIAELATKPTGELKEEDAKTLGQWFVDQSKVAPDGIDTYMLQRAAEYHSIYLRLHGDSDLIGKAMALQLKEIEKRYRASAPVVASSLITLPVKTIHLFQGREIGREAKVNGVRLVNSFQTHPASGNPARVEFRLDGKYATLQGGIGLNDPTSVPFSEMTFIVIADGKELWTSKPTRKSNVVQVFHVNVESVEKLELKVACAGGHDFCWAVWVEPTLYSKPLPPLTNKKEFAGVPIDTKAQ